MANHCPNCRAPLPESSIDRDREIATCNSCARVIDLRAHPILEAPDAAPAPSKATRPRAQVALPTGMQLTVEPPRTGAPGAMTITRRWLRTKHHVMLAVLLLASAGIIYTWMENGYSVPLLLGTLFAASWAYLLLNVFVNRTTVRVGDGRVDVRHGPLPSILAMGGKTFAQADLTQLFVARRGAGFAVKAQLADGRVEDLVTPLTSDEQALYIEQQIERALGIVDFEVSDELPVAGAGQSSAGARRPPILALIPLLAVGAILLFFFFVTSVSVGGSLTAGAPLGSWVFAPDDCESGQRQGFHGVELVSSADATRRIRLVRDVVRGEIVVVDEPGQQPRSLTAEDCRRFALDLRQTDTNINEVWVMEGTVSLDCDELAGNVSFAGCH